MTPLLPLLDHGNHGGVGFRHGAVAGAVVNLPAAHRRGPNSRFSQGVITQVQCFPQG